MPPKKKAVTPKAPVKRKSTYVTGWCQNGWCEGVADVPGRKGLPTPRCKGLYESQAAGKKVETICAHDCHKSITEMYETAGIPREWPMSQWSEEDMRLRRESGDLYDPRVLEACLEDSRRRSVVVLDEQALTPVPTLAEREVVTTLEDILPPNPYVGDPSRRDAGYRPKGQLLFDVKIAVDGWVLGAHPHIPVLNTSSIASLVNEKMPPSTGAITNILQRWRQVGFANIEERPWRFLSYTEIGVKMGFDELAASYKAGIASEAAVLDRSRKAALRNGTRH